MSNLSAFRNTVSPRIIDGLPDLQLENLSDEQLKTIERIHIVACRHRNARRHGREVCDRRNGTYSC